MGEAPSHAEHVALLSHSAQPSAHGTLWILFEHVQSPPPVQLLGVSYPSSHVHAPP